MLPITFTTTLPFWRAAVTTTTSPDCRYTPVTEKGSPLIGW